MYTPCVITTNNFQRAWLSAVKEILSCHGERYNLIAHILDPTSIDLSLHSSIVNFTKSLGLITPKAVAYTIFPHGLYSRVRSSKKLFELYNGPRGLYVRLKKRFPRTWGTYFRRMTSYNQQVNQLDNIIEAIKRRSRKYKAGYSLVIQKPGGETIRPRGGPCLVSVQVQIVKGSSATLSLLCLYRNHDFLTRAYGNYWGLCNLLQFIARESGLAPGNLTCVSSHAFISGHKRSLRAFINSLP